MTKLLLQGGSLIDETGRLQKGQDILICGGKIAAIGEKLAAADAQTVDCSGSYITPGFAVLHAHSPMHILRGLAEDVNIDDWFNARIFPYESKLTDRDVYCGARLCMAELLENGVTVFADHYFGSRQVAQAAMDIGIKCDLAPTIFGFGGDAGKEIDETRMLIREYGGNSLLRVRFGPHSPYLCQPRVLRQVVDAARECGVGIHLHVSETAAQVNKSNSDHGKTPFAVTAAAGGFTVPCIVAHGLWIEEDDLRLLAQDTFVAISPKTYMKLGMGKGGLWKYWDRINLCIGTDGAASSNTVDPLEQLRLFALLGKWEDRAEEFTTTQLWQILMNGHRALPFDSGRLAPGAAADLNVWRLDKPNTAPAHDPLAAIIYSGNRGNIQHTIVNGSFVKKDFALVHDISGLMTEAEELAEGIRRRGMGETQLSF